MVYITHFLYDLAKSALNLKGPVLKLTFFVWLSGIFLIILPPPLFLAELKQGGGRIIKGGRIIINRPDLYFPSEENWCGLLDLFFVRAAHTYRSRAPLRSLPIPEISSVNLYKNSCLARWMTKTTWIQFSHYDLTSNLMNFLTRN